MHGVAQPALGEAEKCVQKKSITSGGTKLDKVKLRCLRKRWSVADLKLYSCARTLADGMDVKTGGQSLILINCSSPALTHGKNPKI